MYSNCFICVRPYIGYSFIIFNDLTYFHIKVVYVILLVINAHFVVIILTCTYIIQTFSGGEVPATKLAALQKVLQSDFLSAVREVYEHVYETVDIQV